MKLKLIITTLIIAFAVSGCSAKENHENTAGTSSTDTPVKTDSADRKDDNIIDDAGDAVKDMTDGAGNAVKDAGNGAGNAVKSIAK